MYGDKTQALNVWICLTTCEALLKDFLKDFLRASFSAGVSSHHHTIYHHTPLHCQAAKQAEASMPVQVPEEPVLLTQQRQQETLLPDSLPARETNQRRDPGCFRASFMTRIICLTLASWVHRPGGLRQTPLCPPTVCCLWRLQARGRASSRRQPAGPGGRHGGGQWWGSLRSTTHNPFGCTWAGLTWTLLRH